MNKKVIDWNGDVQPEAVDILSGTGGMIVSSTKVGYIIMTSDGMGLKRKFAAKQRNLDKPGVVLCGSMEQLRELADMTGEIDAFYQKPGMKTFFLVAFCPGRRKRRRNTFPTTVRLN